MPRRATIPDAIQSRFSISREPFGTLSPFGLAGRVDLELRELIVFASRVLENIQIQENALFLKGVPRREDIAEGTRDKHFWRWL